MFGIFFSPLANYLLLYHTLVCAIFEDFFCLSSGRKINQKDELEGEIIIQHDLDTNQSF